MAGLTSRREGTLTDRAFSELILRQAAPSSAVAIPVVNPAQKFPEPSEMQKEFAEELRPEGENAATSQTLGKASELHVPQALAQPETGISSADETGSRPAETVPAVRSAAGPIAAKTATALASRATQSARKSSAAHAAPATKAPASVGPVAADPQNAAPTKASCFAAAPTADPKTGILADGPCPATAVAFQGTRSTVTAPNTHAGAKPGWIAPQSPAPVPASTVNAEPSAGKTQNDRSESRLHGSARSDGADPAPGPGPEAVRIPRAAERSPSENLRTATAALASPANAAERSDAAAVQLTPAETTGVAISPGPTAHIVHMNPISAAVPSSNGAPAAVSVAFARMDSAAPPQVLESVPQRLSVGIRDGGLGWVEIHTHAAAGQVSAVLATGSNEAHAALEAHLPELREYLAGQQVHVDQLASERFSSSGGRHEYSPQQEGRNADSGNANTTGDPLPIAAGFSDSAEESLSYINVRV